MSQLDFEGPVDPVTPTRPIRILALSGGGYRGLFTAEILVRLEAAAKGRLIRDLFDLTIGTSAGSLIAAGVATGVAAVKIRDAFQENGQLIFPKSFLNKTKQIAYKAPYTAEPLAIAIEKILGDSASQPINALRANLAITAVSQTQAEARVYVSGRFAPAGTGPGDILLREAILASAAAPTYFPQRRPDAETLVDGGLIANAPGMVALGLIRSVLGTPLDRIEVFAIGTASPKAGSAAAAPKPLSFLGWMRPDRNLLLLTLEAQEHLSNRLMRQLLGDRFISLDVKPSPEQAKVMGAIDAADERASKTLAALAQQVWQDNAAAVLAKLQFDKRLIS